MVAFCRSMINHERYPYLGALSLSPGNFPARKAILSYMFLKNKEVYGPETLNKENLCSN